MQSSTTNQYSASRRATLAVVMAGIVLLLAAILHGQQYTLAPSPYQYVVTSAFQIVPNGCVWTYAAGTTTAIATYADTSGTLNGNPIIADNFGRFTAYLLPGTNYKFQFENVPCSSPSTHGALIKTQDNIQGVPASAANVDIVGTAGEALTAGQCVYLSDGSGSKTPGQWYKCDTTNTYSSTLPEIGIPIASISIGTSGTLRIDGYVTGLSSLTAGADYYASTAGALTSTAPANRRLIGRADTTTTLVVSGNPALMTAAASGTASSVKFLRGDQTWAGNLALTEFDAGNSGTSITINFSTNGPLQKVTRNGNCTYTLTAPAAPGFVTLKMVHDATSNVYTVTFSPVPKYPNGTVPTWTNTNAAIDLLTFYYDGSTWFAVVQTALA